MTTKRAKRCVPDPDARSIVQPDRDVRVLLSLAWAGILSTRQIERLHFPSRRTAERRLRALFDHGLVRAHLQGEALHRENVHTLTKRGAAMLESDRGVDPGHVRLARLPKTRKLKHTLAIRDVFVSFLEAERDGLLQVVDFRFEGDLAHDPAVGLPGIVPDAICTVRALDHDRVLLVEVDLGTETKAMLEKKLVSYRAALAGAHAGRHADARTLLIVAHDPRRAASLAALVARHGLGHIARVVTFGTLAALLAADYSHAPFARAIRTVRTGAGAVLGDTTVISQDDAAAFRPLGRV